MSTIKVNKIENTSTTDGGIEVDTSGHVKIDGQQLPTAGPLSNRNLIINGAMRVAQRGASTSVAAADGDTFSVDRFFVLITGNAQITYSRSTEAPVDFSNSIKLDVTTADTLNTNNQLKLEHRVEGNNSAFLNWGTPDAKTVTLSFWIKSNLTGNTQVAFVNDDNDRNYVATFTIDSANTWEQKTLTVPGDTQGTWKTGNNIGIRLRWGSFGTDYQTSSVDQWVANATQLNSRSDSPINFASSTDNELYLTGVQLEVGSKATPFEHRSFGDELQKCDRYCQVYRYPNQYEHICQGIISSSTNELQNEFPLRGEMRTFPSCTLSAIGHFRVNDYRGHDEDANNFVGIYAGSTSTVKITFKKATSNMDTGRAGYMNVSASAGGACKLTFSAEL